ncbi:uncharacterized protein PRCAT00001469001 [Priceomyces carsonii]|uniref:uncharacterized protein n=1 Tax=Priceomyces carsonii TaxID=28549 RepID=UPI002ED9524C|nr:unnamed protein product [Priceomyces carsonii]
MTKEDYNYVYYSDSPEVLHSIDQWNKLNDSKQKEVKGHLPENWPEKLSGPHLWTGEDLKERPDKYRYILSEEDKSEVWKAVESFKKSGLSLAAVSKENFTLPQLGKTLENFAEDLYNGTGVRLIRGLNIDDYDEKGKIIAYLGISSFIGDIRDAQGLNRALTHIKSIEHIAKGERAPIGVSQQTTDAQMFHNDFGGDIVSLFVLSTPLSGGESLVSSTYAIYNELAHVRPDILSTLSTPRAFKWREAPEGSPLLYYKDDTFITSFSTRYFIGYGELPRDENYPLINENQRDALGGFNAIAYKHSLSSEFQKGDIEYVNNIFTQHCRKGFTENEDNRRHLVRLWLRNSKFTNSIKLPERLLEKKIQNFPVQYDQEIPLNEVEEDAIKLRNNATSIDKFYSKPK